MAANNLLLLRNNSLASFEVYRSITLAALPCKLPYFYTVSKNFIFAINEKKNCLSDCPGSCSAGDSRDENYVNI